MSRIFSRTGLSFAAVSVATLVLTACSGADTSTSGAETTETATAETGADAGTDNGAAAIIEARQAGFKNLGKNFKAIADQLREGVTDVLVVQESAGVVAETAGDIGDWFPEGTSAAAGVKTRALDTIWQQPAEFSAAIEQFQSAAAGLTAATQNGDASAIQAAFQTTGGACKNCHDTFRAEEK